MKVGATIWNAVAGVSPVLSQLDMTAPPVVLSDEERAVLLAEYRAHIAEMQRPFQRNRSPLMAPPRARWVRS